jgi:hypothetical protein
LPSDAIQHATAATTANHYVDGADDPYEKADSDNGNDNDRAQDQAEHTDQQLGLFLGS